VTRCYAWPLTTRTDLKLHVSTELPRFGVRLFRYGAAVEEVPGPAQLFDGFDLPLGRPDEAWGWPRYTIELGAGLDDGIYLAVPSPLTADGGIEQVDAGPELATRPDACRGHPGQAPDGHVYRLQRHRRREHVRGRVLGP
jgi:hypothetical protein